MIGTSFRPEEKPMENDRVDCQLISIANDISIGGKYLICILENEWSREDEGGGQFSFGAFFICVRLARSLCFVPQFCDIILSLINAIRRVLPS